MYQEGRLNKFEYHIGSTKDLSLDYNPTPSEIMLKAIFMRYYVVIWGQTFILNQNPGALMEPIR